MMAAVIPAVTQVQPGRQVELKGSKCLEDSSGRTAVRYPGVAAHSLP